MPRFRVISPFFLAIVFVSQIGCFGLRRPVARASGDVIPASPLPPESPAIDIQPPPAPLPDEMLKPAPADADSPLRRLTHRAIEREKTLNNYIVRMRRREQVHGKQQPEEVILLKYRRAPLSVHFKWLGDEARGREIVYVQGQHENRIHLLTGKGDLLGSGRKMSFTPDNPLVRSQSRYPVTEAGLGAATLRFAALMEAVERNQSNAGSARYLGLMNRPEFPRPVEAVEQSIPPGLEAFLPNGGTRFYFFDQDLGVPTVVYTLDPNKVEVEYYHFDRLQAVNNLDERDFDPATLWPR